MTKLKQNYIAGEWQDGASADLGFRHEDTCGWADDQTFGDVEMFTLGGFAGVTGTEGLE